MAVVDPSLFSNVSSSVQRTASLPGGAVRGLPNGLVISGLEGVGSFAGDLSEAHTEYKLGRVQSALKRVRQMEQQFNAAAGRWTSMTGSIIASAKKGDQKLALQKLNDVKNAQTKMQALIGPPTKAFRDLVSALELAVSLDGRETDEEEEMISDKETKTSAEQAQDDGAELSNVVSVEKQPEDEAPDLDLIGNFATNYRFGEKLQLKRGSDGKKRITPTLETNQFYFVAGFEPSRVVRIREIQKQDIFVFDTLHACEASIGAKQLIELLRDGVWRLVAKEFKAS